MTKLTSVSLRRVAVAGMVAAVGVSGLMIGAGSAEAGRLPSGKKVSTGIDGQVVSIARTGESVYRLPSVAANGAGRSAAISGTYSAKLSKGTGVLSVGYLVGCQVNITGFSGDLTASITPTPSLTGSLTVPLKPGEVTLVSAEGLSLSKGKGTVLVDSFQLDVQQCGGYASARSVVRVMAADGYTAADESLSGSSGLLQSTLYGKPFSLG